MQTQYERVVKKFRSQKHLASLLGLNQQTIAAWSKRGFIPSKHHAEIIRKAKDEGISVTMADFFPPDISGEAA